MTATDRNDFLESVTGWVHLLARRHARRRHLDPEDVANAAFVELLRTADRYDPTRGKPTTFAAFAVRHAATALARGEWRARAGGLTRVYPVVDRSTGELDVGGKEYGSIGPDPADLAEVGDLAAVALDRLDDGPRELVERCFGIGRPVESRADIGATLGVTSCRVSQRIRVAVETMASGRD